MKKITPLLSFLLFAFAANAQRAVFKNNGAIYKGKTYMAGDTLKLGAGTQADKSFAYISTEPDQKDLKKEFANNMVVIEKVYIEKKVVLINAKILTGTADKILIDLEGAVENEEIK